MRPNLLIAMIALSGLALFARAEPASDEVSVPGQVEQQEAGAQCPVLPANASWVARTIPWAYLLICCGAIGVGIVRVIHGEAGFAPDHHSDGHHVHHGHGQGDDHH